MVDEPFTDTHEGGGAGITNDVTVSDGVVELLYRPRVGRQPDHAELCTGIENMMVGIRRLPAGR